MADAGPEPEPQALPTTDDPFELLGLRRGATADAAKAAFRQLALRHHPDKGGGTEDFQRIQDALHRVLQEADGVTGTVAPRRAGGQSAAEAARQQSAPLPLPAQCGGWRLALSPNALGYEFLCAAHPAGPCLAFHSASLGGFQFRRRRGAGDGWLPDAEAFTDGAGARPSAMMVNMVSPHHFAAMLGDGREQAQLTPEASYEWGYWRLRPGASAAPGGSLRIGNSRLLRSSFGLDCSAAGTVRFTTTGGEAHELA